MMAFPRYYRVIPALFSHTLLAPASLSANLPSSAFLHSSYSHYTAQLVTSADIN